MIKGFRKKWAAYVGFLKNVPPSERFFYNHYITNDMEGNMKAFKSISLLMLLMMAAAVFATPPVVAANEIRFGYVDWPGVTVKTTVASQILELLGYETDMKSLAVPVVFKGLSNEDLDVFVGAWLPTMKSIAEKYFNDGSIVPVTVNLDETIYTLAVPQYAWDAGCKSHADLVKFADKFDRKIVGIEPGNDGNQIVLDMIENDTYGLKDWELIESSTEAMMIAVGSAIKKDEWVCWLGWSPHWMNLSYDIRYLEDPEQVWGSEPEVVKTIARAGFEKDLPNVYRFFQQYRVTPDIQGDWIDQYSRQKKDADEVARSWIKDNLKVVDMWVYGVTALDGSRARDAIRRGLMQ
jgi:glycine betaine/proline transport system substrate-binding protein